ncbi:MAG TPA: hypothetical protein PKM70_05135 [Clostridia bacterium]|nr:hypothetical protein [Clostridia bacterium]
MFKLATLIQILAITTIIILLSVIAMQTIVNDMTNSVPGDIYTSTMKVTGISYLGNGMSLVTGKDGKNAFFKIYGANSNLLDEESLHLEGFDLSIDDISIKENNFAIICRAKKGRQLKGVLYVYDYLRNSLDKWEFLHIPETVDTSFFISDNFYFAAGRENIYLLNTNHSATFPLNNVNKVNDICVVNDKVYVVGQKALTVEEQDKKYAFYSCYSLSGELLWEKSTMEDVNSMLERILPISDGHFILHGLMSKNVKTSIDSYSKRYVNTKDDVFSIFLLNIDKEGNVVEASVFENENGIVLKKLTGMSKYNRLTGYGAVSNDEKGKYTFHLSLTNKELANISRSSFASDADLVYHITGDEDNGIYCLVNINGTGNYRLNYFASMKDFVSQMKTLNSLRGIVGKVCSHISTIIYIYIGFATWFILKIKYYRRNGNG